nr:MAG TPA: hypothetical protein [Caudoviricetes sp.]
MYILFYSIPEYLNAGFIELPCKVFSFGVIREFKYPVILYRLVSFGLFCAVVANIKSLRHFKTI